MPTDEQLFKQTCLGQRDAFNTLYARYEKRLFGFILSYVKNRQDAEEVFHDSFCTILDFAKGEKREGAVREQPSSFNAWLFTIARNLALNRLRTRRSLLSIDENVPHDGPPTDLRVLQNEKEEALTHAVQSLPPKLAAIYQLRANGESYEGMAEKLDIPIGTVRSRMNTLVRKLREDLQVWIAH